MNGQRSSACLAFRGGARLPWGTYVGKEGNVMRQDVQAAVDRITNRIVGRLT